jgi:hypothetical protein
MRYPNLPIDQAEFVILASDEEMIALEELFALACPKRDFRQGTKWLLSKIIEMCACRREAEVDIDVYSQTNLFFACLPDEITRGHYRIYPVDSQSVVHPAPKRKDPRTPKQIVGDLARNLCFQLRCYDLYSETGNLVFEYDHIVPAGSLEIRLRRK